MGDLPKPSDDVTWTDMELSFFAAAPPDEPEPAVEAPRGDERAAPLGRARVVLRAAGARAWQAARAGAADLTAAFSSWRGDRRRVALAFVAAIVASGLSAGMGAFGRPVARTVAEPASPPNLPSPAPVQAPRAEASNGRARPHHRRAVAARSAPARAGRPFFSR